MIAKEIGQYLDDRGIGTLGIDIHIGGFPKEDSSGNSKQSGLFLTLGPGEGQDAYLSIRYENIDIWSVNPDSESAYDKLVEVHDQLSRGQNYITPNYHIFFSHDTSGIADFGRTQDGLRMYKFSLRIIYRDINLIS